MRSFIDELRHRNVLRVAAAYIVIGWVITQVADVVGGAFGLPEWFLQMIIVALALGLPIALFLAWAFELTPEGMRKADEVPIDAPKDPRSGRVLNLIIIGTLLVAVALLGWDKLRGSAQGGGDIAAVEKSIAVLPFDDFSPAGDHAWFADGLTEEILNSLARITDLQVASRTSSFNYRGQNQDIPAIAAELDVAHILEGSVRRAGDQLRVTAQLIRASDDKHLWSENFDGSIENSIEIQEAIAFEIANALQTAMDPEELARMLSAGTRSVEAWETYLEALSVLNERSGQGRQSGAYDVIAVLDKAVAIDPSFADAQLLLANAWEGQVDPTNTMYSVAGPPMAERRANYDKALSAATEHARSEATRLETMMRAAAGDLRIMDQIDFAKRMVDNEPERRVGWSWLQHLYQAIGEYALSTEAGWKAWEAPEEPDATRRPILQTMHRTDLDAAVQMLDELLAEASPSSNLLYQAHRVLLADGQVERAAALARDYVSGSADAEGKIMVQIRQACAEGRVTDADLLFEQISADSNSYWLFLKTLGLDDLAREKLRPLDAPDTLYALSGYLSYRFFEARDYPRLWQKLERQGINRPPAAPMAYSCER